MIALRSMGCDVVLSRDRAEAETRAIFVDRDRCADSDLSNANARPSRVAVLSADFAELPSLAVRVAGSTDGLATSSVAARSRLRGGARRHRLIDPATGRPARTPWRDVTVAAQDCVAADVAAKVALLGGACGPSWLDRRCLPGRFIDGRGAVHVKPARRDVVPEPLAA